MIEVQKEKISFSIDRIFFPKSTECAIMCEKVGILTPPRKRHAVKGVAITFRSCLVPVIDGRNPREGGEGGICHLQPSFCKVALFFTHAQAGKLVVR